MTQLSRLATAKPSRRNTARASFLNLNHSRSQDQIHHVSDGFGRLNILGQVQQQFKYNPSHNIGMFVMEESSFMLSDGFEVSSSSFDLSSPAIAITRPNALLFSPTFVRVFRGFYCLMQTSNVHVPTYEGGAAPRPRPNPPRLKYVSKVNIYSGFILNLQ